MNFDANSFLLGLFAAFVTCAVTVSLISCAIERREKALAEELALLERWACMEDVREPLIDPEDGENRAVRYFLGAYGCGMHTFEGMRTHMQLAGYPLWPEWAATATGHLTKLGAQNWLRYLFNLEKGEENGTAS